MRLRQKGQSAFDLRLVAFGDEQTAGPTVGADKVEVARQVVAPDGPHHSRHFLVAAEDDDAFSLWLRVDFEDDAVVSGVAGHARILHQTLPHRDADVVLGQQLLQLFERLPHYNRVNICPSPIRVGRRRPSSSANWPRINPICRPADGFVSNIDTLDHYWCSTADFLFFLLLFVFDGGSLYQLDPNPISHHVTFRPFSSMSIQQTFDIMSYSNRTCYTGQFRSKTPFFCPKKNSACKERIAFHLWHNRRQ